MLAQSRGGVDIGSSTDGSGGHRVVGDGGNVEVVAPLITVTGVDATNGTLTTNSDGNGGDITVTADRIEVLGGWSFFASTSGGGTAGTLTVNADTLVVRNEATEVPSDITGFSNPCFSCGGTVNSPAGRVVSQFEI